MELNSKQVEGFVTTLLAKNYDGPTPIPDLHREIWEMATTEERRVAIAAPRGHAKSTCVSHAFVLANALFRRGKYILIISNTESQASNFLSGIKQELAENRDLRELFGVYRFITDAVTNIIVEMNDGYKFRITAMGAEQRVRGRLWSGTRPDLIVCDDIEDDEQVESQDRREKFRNWFFKALMPALSKRGRIRVVGTILHLDSLLMRLINNKTWTSKLYTAHKSFDDFSEILWPEMWPETRLREERDQYIEEGFPEGYSQEYLNNPIDQSDAFFRREDFIPMGENDHIIPKTYYAGLDFAISDADRADYTVIVVGGMDAAGLLYIVDVIRFRGDTEEIVSYMLATQRKWSIDLWKVEDGVIFKGMQGELFRRMQDDNTYMNLSPGTPSKDKRSRARPIQGRVRAAGVKVDTQAPWFATFEEELIQFPKGPKKDQVDAFAWLGIGINELALGPTTKEIADEEWDDEYGESFSLVGQSMITGY